MSQDFTIHEMHRPFERGGRVDAPGIARVLGGLYAEHPLTQHRKHDLLEPFKDPKRATAFVGRLIKRGMDAQSPVNPYLLFRGQRTLDRLAGMAICIQDIPLKYRPDRSTATDEISLPSSLILVAPGTGGVESFATACEQVKVVAGGERKVATERSDSLVEVQDVLRDVFGHGLIGYFATGLKFGTAESHGFGYEPKVVQQPRE